MAFSSLNYLYKVVARSSWVVPESREELVERMAPTERPALFVAFKCDALIGMVVVRRDQFHFSRRKAHLWRNYVAPRYRRSGASVCCSKPSAKSRPCSRISAQPCCCGKQCQLSAFTRRSASKSSSARRPACSKRIRVITSCTCVCAWNLADPRPLLAAASIIAATRYDFRSSANLPFAPRFPVLLNRPERLTTLKLLNSVEVGNVVTFSKFRPGML